MLLLKLYAIPHVVCTFLLPLQLHMIVSQIHQKLFRKGLCHLDPLKVYKGCLATFLKQWHRLLPITQYQRCHLDPLRLFWKKFGRGNKMKNMKFDQGHGLGNLLWTLLISTITSGVSSTLRAFRTSWSCHDLVAPKTTLATRGWLKTKAVVSFKNAENMNMKYKVNIYTKDNNRGRIYHYIKLMKDVFAQATRAYNHAAICVWFEQPYREKGKRNKNNGIFSRRNAFASMITDFEFCSISQEWERERESWMTWCTYCKRYWMKTILFCNINVFLWTKANESKLVKSAWEGKNSETRVPVYHVPCLLLLWSD